MQPVKIDTSSYDFSFMFFIHGLFTHSNWEQSSCSRLTHPVQFKESALVYVFYENIHPSEETYIKNYT
jgi:hypothetical protein